MLKTTIKGLAAHKLRLLSTATAVMLGVAFMSGVLVLKDSLGRSFDDLFAQVNAGTDAVVRADDEVAGVRPRIDAALVDEIAEVDGVGAVQGGVVGYAQYLDRDGEPMGNPANGAPTFGFNWGEVGEVNPMNLVEGRAPVAPGEVVADKRTADLGNFEVGDKVTVLTTKGRHELELVGVARFGTADSPLGASVALLETESAQQLFGAPGQFDEISVVAADGVGQRELVANIDAALVGRGIESLTGEAYTAENQSDVASDLAFFNTFLIAFAVIALFVGSFIIYNTFSIIVAQRSKEMALLRAIGATRRQVLRSVLLEAVVVGAIASLVGLAFGVFVAQGLTAVLGAFGIDVPGGGVVITTATIVIAFLSGLGVSVASAFLPARRAAKVPPIAAMRELAIDSSGSSILRTVIGVLVTGGGAAALLAGLFGNGGFNTVGLGAVAVFVGVSILGPVIARPLSRVLGAPLPRLRGITGTLARENAMRNPKRSASTAAALMIGVGLVGFFTVFAASIKASLNDAIDEAFTGDYVIDSGLLGFGGLDPQLTADIAALPEVEAATGVRYAVAEIDGDDRDFVGIDPTNIEKIFDPDVTAGRLADLDADGLAVHDELADANGWSLGSRLPVKFPGQEPAELEVVVIYQDNGLAGDIFAGMAALDANGVDAVDSSIYIGATDDVTAEQARSAIESVAAPYPTAEVNDLTEVKAAMAGQINQIVGVVFAMLALAILIALMGIANTLSLSIYERTRELGLLRAVGMTRSQLRASVRWESVLIALLGTALGLSIGMFFGWALIRALADEGLDNFVVPIGQLVTLTVIAALAGVGATILPARRASRLNVLDAIAT